jgi:histone H2A
VSGFTHRLLTLSSVSSCSQATIAGGGVIPHIHKSLIGKKGSHKAQ